MFAGRDSQLQGRSRLRNLQASHREADDEMDVERQRFQRLAGDDAKPKVFSSFNLFPTPPDVADQVIELARIKAGQLVLEPSAGTGNLLRAMYKLDFHQLPDGGDVYAVEIADGLCTFLKNEFPCAHVYKQDFLTWQCAKLFDRVVMNPPFKMGTDIKHIRRAMEFLKPGGRLVSVCANGPRQREKLQPIATHWIELPPGSFKSEGTNVATSLFVFDNPGE